MYWALKNGGNLLGEGESAGTSRDVCLSRGCSFTSAHERHAETTAKEVHPHGLELRSLRYLPMLMALIHLTNITLLTTLRVFAILEALEIHIKMAPACHQSTTMG